jgi:hypothetical protein
MHLKARHRERAPHVRRQASIHCHPFAGRTGQVQSANANVARPTIAWPALYAQFIDFL